MRVWNAIRSISEDYESSPITEPVSLDEAKTYLMMEGFQDVDESTPLDFDGEDDMLESIIAASRKTVERSTGLHLVSKTIRVLHTNLAGDLELPGPWVAFVSFEDSEGTEVDEEDVTLVGDEFKVLIFPKYENATIEYQAGYESDNLPEDVKEAVLKEILYRYELTRSKDVAYVRNLKSAAISARKILKR